MSSDLPNLSTRDRHMPCRYPERQRAKNAPSASSSSRSGSLEFGLPRVIYGISKLTVWGLRLARSSGRSTSAVFAGQNVTGIDPRVSFLGDR